MTESTRKHRFLVRLFDPLSSDLLFFARKIVIPAVEIDRVVMHHKQEEIYLPGKHRYQQCEINFYRAHDTNGDRAARELYDWWANNFLSVKTSSLLADPSGSVRKRNGEVQVLDGKGDAAYKYKLYGVWPQKMTPDTFDFSDDNISEISCVFLVDKVKEESGVGALFATDVPCEPSLTGTTSIGGL